MQAWNAYISLEISIYDDTSRNYKLTSIVIHFWKPISTLHTYVQQFWFQTQQSINQSINRLKIYWSIILSFRLWTSKWTVPLRFCNQSFVSTCIIYSTHHILYDFVTQIYVTVLAIFCFSLYLVCRLRQHCGKEVWGVLVWFGVHWSMSLVVYLMR